MIQIWLAPRLLLEDRIWEVSEGWDWLLTVWELKGEVIDFVVTIAWLVWYACNSIVHDEVPWNAGGIIDKA